MAPGRRVAWVGVTLGVALAQALLAPPSHAKSWAKWAPSPLGSDSSYAALAARPADSLDTRAFAWMQVQRDWRAQRDAEAGRGGGSSLTGFDRVAHRSRPSDGRFAALASKPYVELSDVEVSWLVAENAAQHQGVTESRQTVMGLLLFGTMILAAVGAWTLYELGHVGWF